MQFRLILKIIPSVDVISLDMSQGHPFDLIPKIADAFINLGLIKDVIKNNESILRIESSDLFRIEIIDIK